MPRSYARGWNCPNAYTISLIMMAPDTLSRVCCSTLSRSSLYNIQSAMCHPGITRMYHYVRSKNVPYSLNDMRQMTFCCKVCAQIKLRLLKPSYMSLVKATQPMERLSLDFNCPLPPRTKNKYILTVVDEYSRFRVVIY